MRAERQPSGELVGIADDTQTRLEIRAVGGSIDSSLYAAIKNAGETAALVDFFVDVFAYDIDFFNDTHDGDTFRIVVEKHLTSGGSAPGSPQDVVTSSAPGSAQGEFIKYGRILAAEYRGKAGTFQTFYWNGRYYDANGQSSEKGMLKTPLKYARVSSGFDRRRMHG